MEAALTGHPERREGRVTRGDIRRGIRSAHMPLPRSIHSPMRIERPASSSTSTNRPAFAPGPSSNTTSRSRSRDAPHRRRAHFLVSLEEPAGLPRPIHRARAEAQRRVLQADLDGQRYPQTSQSRSSRAPPSPSSWTPRYGSTPHASRVKVRPTSNIVGLSAHRAPPVLRGSFIMSSVREDYASLRKACQLEMRNLPAGLGSSGAADGDRRRCARAHRADADATRHAAERPVLLRRTNRCSAGRPLSWMQAYSPPRPSRTAPRPRSHRSA